MPVILFQFSMYQQVSYASRVMFLQSPFYISVGLVLEKTFRWTVLFSSSMMDADSVAMHHAVLFQSSLKQLCLK